MLYSPNDCSKVRHLPSLLAYGTPVHTVVLWFIGSQSSSCRYGTLKQSRTHEQGAPVRHGCNGLRRDGIKENAQAVQRQRKAHPQ